MNLAQIWKDFAGPIPTKLSFSKKATDIDDDLLGNLDLARSKFSSLSPLKHYFSKPPTSPKRKIQWAQSRRCVLEAVKDLPPSPRTFLSLSHTESESIVIGCHDDKGFVTGIGVDMEKQDRVIEPGATDKFILPTELNFGLNAIAIWTIKEATYKADTQRLGAVVSDYEIKDFNSSGGEGRVGLKDKPNSFFRYRFLIYENLAITFAIGAKALGVTTV